MKKTRKKFIHLLNFFLFIEYSTFTNAHRIVDSKERRWAQNVGTVLFDKSDLDRKCWSSEEMILLKSRIIFQDILPEVDLLNVDSDEYIGLLMDYCDICLETVRRLTSGQTKHLILKALADVFAGYLRVYILPLTRKTFYAGNISYQQAKRLFDFYDNLKVLLRSNGVGWLKPIIPRRHFNAAALAPEESRYRHFHQRRGTEPCSGLIVYFGNEGEMTMPMPFLDDDEKPHSIALPFEGHSLYSLFTPNSTFILVKYYRTSMKCLLHQSEKSQVDAFQNELNNWIRHKVERHLDDEKWYPAFGGVLQVTASLKPTGDQEARWYGGMEMPSKNTEDIRWDEINNNSVGLQTMHIIMIVSSIFLILWLLIGLLCNFCKSGNERREDLKNTPIATLYTNIDSFSPDSSAPKERHIFKRFSLSARKKDPLGPTSKCGECSGEEEIEDDEEESLLSRYYSDDTANRVDIAWKKYPKYKSEPLFAVPVIDRSTLGMPYAVTKIPDVE